MTSAFSPQPAAVITQEERILGGLCHVAMFVGFPVVGPAALYFVKRDTSPFVAFHALQAIFLAIAAVPFVIVLWIISFVVGIIGVGVAQAGPRGTETLYAILSSLLMVGGFAVPALVVCVVSAYAGYKAFIGERFHIPLIGRLAEKVISAPKGPTPATRPG